MLWPATAPAIPGGALLIGSDGRIAAVGPEAAVPRPEDAAVLALRGAAVLPGFINAHTHLELSGLRGRLHDPDFYEWIQQIRRLKEGTPADAYLEGARAGVREAWRYGATMVADTGTSGAAVRALTELGGAGTAYHEAISPETQQAKPTMASACREVERLRAEAGPRVTVGLSPHAPYTVSRELYRLVAAYARAEGLPLAGHIAESPAEVAFVSAQRGPFADAWRRRSIPLDPPAASPVRLLHELGLLGPDFLAIHAVQTDEQDLDALATTGTPVVVCPRSNARHGHGAAPLARYLDRRLRVALGTDSLASVDSLDLLAEAREARLLAGLSAEAALRLLTLDGARALRQEREVGSLEPGKWADLVVVRLPGPAPLAADLAAEAILLARPDDIVATFVAGRAVYEARPGGVSAS